MRKKWLLAALGVAVLAGSVAYVRRDAIAMNLFARAVEKTMARDVMADGKLFVFDMGEGSGETLSLMGLPLGNIQGVWLTHLHSDHFEGLGPFTLQRWAGTSATTPLAVLGPEGVNEITDGLNAVYRIDSTYRVAHHGEAIVPLSGFGMTGTAIAPGTVYDKGGVRIAAFAVDHDPIKPAFGYRVEWKGRSVTISGDTAYTAALANAANGSDLLVSETLSPRMVKILEASAREAGNTNRAKIFADIQNYHISPEQAAGVAKQAGVGMLAFTHIVPAVPRFMEGALIGDAAENFGGDIRVMRDGDVVSIIGKGQFETQNLLR